MKRHILFVQFLLVCFNEKTGYKYTRTSFENDMQHIHNAVVRRKGLYDVCRYSVSLVFGAFLSFRLCGMTTCGEQCDSIFSPVSYLGHATKFSFDNQ